jgi:hypothetical protein
MTSRSPSEPTRAGPMPRLLSRTQSSASPLLSFTRNVTLMTPPSSSNAYLTELVTTAFRISPIVTARAHRLEFRIDREVRTTRVDVGAQCLQVVAHIDALALFLKESWSCASPIAITRPMRSRASLARGLHAVATGFLELLEPVHDLRRPTPDSWPWRRELC